MLLILVRFMYSYFYAPKACFTLAVNPCHTTSVAHGARFCLCGLVEGNSLPLNACLLRNACHLELSSLSSGMFEKQKCIKIL
uniref:Uncharacterized protein n=1 Tax=Anguilla anguilla TaxID=7936 RepID=A0A0E9QI61_ANGAN